MQLWLIPILPLLGFLLNGLFGRRIPKAADQRVRRRLGGCCRSLWVVKTLTRWAFGGRSKPSYVEHYFTWIQSGTLNIGVDFAVDRLTAVMLMVVTGVGSLIHIYAIGYMAHEGGYYRFFAYLNLFMFFMLVLVLAQNFLLLFVGWEGVGLCSYLLIGFYFLEKFATTAGNKAFIVNRIGDFGFSLAMFLIVAPLRLARFREGVRRRRKACRWKRAPASSPPSACCCWWARPANPRRSRCTSGCRTPWPARRRFRADPRRHHGHRRRLHDRALATIFHARAICHGHGRRRSAWRPHSSPPPSAWRRTTSRKFSRTPPFRSSATCSWAWAWARFRPASST